MKTLLRTPIVRLVIGAVVLVVGLALFRSMGVFEGDDSERLESSSEVAAPPAVEPAVNVAPEAVVARTSTLDDLGAPDDPLPDPLPVLPSGEPVQSDQGAETLARQILEGGPDFFPALITALQASGIGTVDGDTKEVTKPAEPWQGIVMRRWEVRTAAAMVLPARTVTLSLSDLAAFLVAAIPQLKGAPVEKLIVDDLRAIANSQVPTTRFFGRFIAALGRNAAAHDPYDLLGTVDPQAIRVNGLQASLILRRLAADIALRAGGAKTTTPKKTASIAGTVGDWLVPPVYAQGQTPCAYSTSEGMDAAAVGSSLVWGGVEVGESGMAGLMERLGLEGLGNAAALVSTLLSYAQFIATYAALEAEVTMDAPPLVRTKTTQSGQRRELTAIVKFNVGNAQMLNCFRGLLVAVGLDFSLPNDGPIKGARVSWYGVDGFDLSASVLHGGPEAIVQFVSGGTNRIRDAVTGDDGKVRVGVEGRPQRERIGDEATEVHKSAKVRLDIALKGADLFGDLQEAATTAAGGLVGLATVPLSILTRAQWASAGHYRFPVTDWREGPGEWSGTISVVETTISRSSTTGSRGGADTQETESKQVQIALRETTSELPSGGGGLVATVKGTAEGTYDRQKTFAGYSIDSCGAVKNRRMNNTSRDHSHGTNTGEATINVSVQDDGSYSATAFSEMQITVNGEFTGTLDTFGQGCAVTAKSNSHSFVPLSQGIGGAIQAAGRVDPRNPGVLTGSKSEDLSSSGAGDSSSRTRTTRTTTWNLRRN